MSTTSIIIAIIGFIIFGLMIIYAKKIGPIFGEHLKKLFKFIMNNSYVILIIIAFGYLIFYSIYQISPYYNAKFKENESLIRFAGSMALICLGSGVFSAGIKWLDYLNVFSKNFKKIILSEDFENMLGDKISALAYSKDHLLKQNNLNDIWQKVTLCKYLRDFPLLDGKLKSKIKNDLYLTNNISYYYKNFQATYDIKLIDNRFLQIKEMSSFTIVRPSKDKFNFDFTSTNILDEENDIVRVEGKFNSENEKDVDLKEMLKNEKVVDNKKIVKYKKELSGNFEYHIENEVLNVQDIEKDRFFSFGSGRIIDDLTINIQHDENIIVIFKENNSDRMVHNGAFAEDKLAFINRDVLLPGEKFSLFFYRP